MLVYLPIETVSRELDARCLLAYELKQSGIKVVLGPKGAVTDLASKIGSGVFFDKGFGDL